MTTILSVIQGGTLHRQLYSHPRPGTKWGQTVKAELWSWSSGQGRNWGKLRNGQRLSRWLMGVANAQGSTPDFWRSQGVKHENLMGQDLTMITGGSTGYYVVFPPYNLGRNYVKKKKQTNYVYILSRKKNKINLNNVIQTQLQNVLWTWFKNHQIEH